MEEACNFTKSNTPLWTFFTFFKLHKWYQIAQRITYWDLLFDSYVITQDYQFSYPMFENCINLVLF